MIDGKDLYGYVWIQDSRNDEYYYLKDFEHLVVMKVEKEQWEAILFEDERCQKVIGRQEFATKRAAQESLEALMEIVIKNRNKSN
jgi:hypothetical protein